MSELLILGISHKTAPVEVRELLALPDARAEEFARKLVGEAEISECVTISTCNRTEVYLVSTDPVAAEAAALAKLAKQAEIRPTELIDAIYSLRNCDAARHLFSVSAGLDSMIIGEAEVQGQVRRAYETMLAAGLTGPLTNRLFRAAIETGKRVRSETKIGERKLSVSSVAVELAHSTIGELKSRRVVILGAGEMAELTAKALADEGVGTIFVANRRRERALALADRFSGHAVSFDDLPRELEAADIVLASTSSPHPIVGPEELELVMRARDDRPLLFIDIAVPRDIDSACAQLDGVTLYDIDDLQAVVERNRSVRKAEARGAEAIIDEEIQRFARWLGSLEVLPTISDLREHGEHVVATVLAENSGRWESASQQDLERTEQIALTVMKRLLHEPTVRLKKTGGDRRHSALQVLRELFGLGEHGQQNESGEQAEIHELAERRRAR